MKTFDFKCGLDEGEFFYCYSPQAKSRGVFVREDDCIRNEYNPDVKDYEYTTVMLKEKLKAGDAVTVECSFEKRGAPLIVISDEIFRKDGSQYYGEHFETVAFEEGCNVWHNTPIESGGLKTDKLHFESIPTPNHSRVTLSVEFMADGFYITMNGVSFTVKASIPKEFYLGITGCEGINRFYNFTLNRC